MDVTRSSRIREWSEKKTKDKKKVTRLKLLKKKFIKNQKKAKANTLSFTK